jgi:hypothetical protein
MRSAQKRHSVQLCKKRRLWRTAHPMAAGCFMVLNKLKVVSLPYIRALPLKVNGLMPCASLRESD